MNGLPRAADGSWWVFQQTQTPQGDFDTSVQLRSGKVLRIVLRAGEQTEQAIAAAVAAFIGNDRRWTKTVDRGRQLDEPGQ